LFWLVLSLFEVVASASWKGLYLVFLLIGLFAFNEILIHQKKKTGSNGKEIGI
jgi:TctA family transporter